MSYTPVRYAYMLPVGLSILVHSFLPGKIDNQIYVCSIGPACFRNHRKKRTYRPVLLSDMVYVRRLSVERTYYNNRHNVDNS